MPRYNATCLGTRQSFSTLTDASTLFSRPSQRNSQHANIPSQAFWDKTGKQWASGAFYGKLAGLFISTGTMGGGQESTALAAMSTLAHHGIVYVPLSYKNAFPILADLSEVRGGSAWGAGTFAGGDGSRQPSDKEIQLAEIQGETFYQFAAKHVAG